MKKKERPSDPEWDPVFKSNYESRLFDSDIWLAKSNELRDVAKLLEPRLAEYWDAQREFMKTGVTGDPRRRDLHGVYFMLMAYAVENFLKAAAIARSVPTDGVFSFRKASKLYQEFEKTGMLPLDIKTHDLFGLTKKIGISYSTEEEDLLRRLTRAAEWYGRYPVPLDFNEMRGAEEFSDGKEYSVAYFSENEVVRIERLWEKLRSELLNNSEPRS